jgi:hypothetical protein
MSTLLDFSVYHIIQACPQEIGDRSSVEGEVFMADDILAI